MGKIISNCRFFLILIYKINNIHGLINNNYNSNFNNSMVLSQQATGPTTITSSGSLVWDGNNCLYKEPNNGMFDTFFSVEENLSYLHENRKNFYFNNDTNSPENNLKYWAFGVNCNKKNCNFEGLLDNKIVYRSLSGDTVLIGQFYCKNPWTALPVLKPNTVLWKNGMCFYTDGDEKNNSDGTPITKCYYPYVTTYQTWDFSSMTLNEVRRANLDENNLCYKYYSSSRGNNIYVLPEQCNLPFLNTKIINAINFYVGDEDINRPIPTLLADPTETYWNGGVCFYGQPQPNQPSYYSTTTIGYSKYFSLSNNLSNPNGINIVDPNSNKLYQNYINDGCYKDSCQWSQIIPNPNGDPTTICNKTQATQLVPQGTSKAIRRVSTCFYTRKTLWKQDNLNMCFFPDINKRFRIIGDDHEDYSWTSSNVGSYSLLGTVVNENVDDNQYCYDYIVEGITQSKCNVEFLDNLPMSEIFFSQVRSFYIVKDVIPMDPIDNSNPKNSRLIDLIDFDLMATIFNGLGKILGIPSPELPNKFHFIPYYLIMIGLNIITPFFLIVAEPLVNFINLLILIV